MKRFLSALMFASAIAFVLTPAAFASTDTAGSTDIEVTIEHDIGSIDEAASTPDGQTVVIDRLEKEFDVDEATIQGLRNKKMGYGEISIALSLASRLPGGLTTENIDKLVAMRQGPPVEGWGNIAKELNLKINPAAERLDKVAGQASKRAESKKEIIRHEKTTKLERAEKPERVEKAQRPERVERIEKIERIARPERPERPERAGKK